MEYKISLAEIKRRKRAYLTLSISILFGLILASVIFKYPISIGSFILFLAAILIIRAFSFGFFRNLTQTKINLSHQSLNRTVNGKSEEFSLSHINHIKIKWTKNDTIREIYIWLDNGESVFITALEKFEEFNHNLQKLLKKDVVIKNTHEPIDYDHPIFYSLLGLPISSLGVFLFKILPSLPYSQLAIGIKIFSIYLFSIGLYFFFAKPISKRSGKSTVTSDYIIGSFMFCSGALFIFLF